MTPMLPAKAAVIIATYPPADMPAAAIVPPVRRVTTATPRLAPDDMPRSDGDASGL